LTDGLPRDDYRHARGCVAAGRGSSYSVSWKHYRELWPPRQPTPGLSLAYSVPGPGIAIVGSTQRSTQTRGDRMPTAPQPVPPVPPLPPVPLVTIDALGRKCPIPI